nr:helix-hairpin-helix domain-containing protein [Desulfobulbaceae bacterium]
MQNRLKVANLNKSVGADEATDSGNKQSILVLVGLCIILSQVISYSTGRTAITSSTDHASDYRAGDNGAILFVSSVQSLTDKTGGHDSHGQLSADMAPFFFRQIPINTASAELLVTIPGIGPRMAWRIRSYIQKNGAMTNISELENIKGIGLLRSKAIANYVRI